MLAVRQYQWREPFAFFTNRYAECIQYSILHAAWIIIATPLETRSNWHDTFSLYVWSRGVPLFVGLNFTWLDRTPLSKISFSYNGWKKAPWLNMITAMALMTIVCAQIWLATDGKEDETNLVVLVVIGTLLQEVFRMVTMNKEKLHVHHYYVGLVGGALCWGTHPYSIFLSHIFWGVYLEGVAAWGRDPVYLDSS